MSCAHALGVTGSAQNSFFVDSNHGVLSSFPHEHFLVFLIAQFSQGYAVNVLRSVDGGYDSP